MKRLIGTFLLLGLVLGSPLKAFISPDPEGHVASMDLYSYCDGDPVNQYDADGRLKTGFNSGLNGSISANAPTSSAFYFANLIGGGVSGAGTGIQNGAGGTVNALSLGNVKGAFGSDPSSFEYHSGQVGGAAIGLGVALGTGGAAYEAGGAFLAANPTLYGAVAAAAPIVYNVGNAITGENPVGSVEQQLYHYTDSAGAAGIRAAGNTLLPGASSGGKVWATSITPQQMFGPLGSVYRLAVGGGINFEFGGSLGIRYTGTTQFTRYFEIANPKQFSPAWIPEPYKALMGQFSTQGAAAVK